MPLQTLLVGVGAVDELHLAHGRIGAELRHDGESRGRVQPVGVEVQVDVQMLHQQPHAQRPDRTDLGACGLPALDEPQPVDDLPGSLRVAGGQS